MNSRVTSFRWRELFPLGEGGMGVTYLGCAKGVGGFERLIAIKRLHEHLQEDEEARTRLLCEAELAGCVQHTNVVGVQHVDQDERGAFLVLDYVDGGSLSQLLKASRPERLPQAIVLRVLLDCLAGLEAIHTATNYRGDPLCILHRDISPDNVLIGLDGRARLTDFGIARAKHHPSLTAPTQLVGKLTYMAPEYIDKRDLGRSLDVYSVGVMMWILLAGRSPWKGLEEAQLLARLLTEGVPPLPDDVPIEKGLREIVRRACAKDPADRYQTAALMSAAIEACGARLAIATNNDVAHFAQRKFDTSTSERRLKAAQMLKLDSVVPPPHDDVPAIEIAPLAPLSWLSEPQSNDAPTAQYESLEASTESYSGEALDSLVRSSRSNFHDGVETITSDATTQKRLPEMHNTLRSRRSSTWGLVLWASLTGVASAAIGVGLTAARGGTKVGQEQPTLDGVPTASPVLSAHVPPVEGVAERSASARPEANGALEQGPPRVPPSGAQPVPSSARPPMRRPDPAPPPNPSGTTPETPKASAETKETSAATHTGSPKPSPPAVDGIVLRNPYRR